MSEFFNLCNPFLYLAIIFAIFYGWRSVYIFVNPETYKKKNWDWWLYQIWFNATGAFIGWFVLYYIWKTGIQNFEVKHFVALIIAFLGITGNLPYAALIGRLPKSPTS
jgi:energy-coupling factor transporter transmembrane protein EcfT